MVAAFGPLHLLCIAIVILLLFLLLRVLFCCWISPTFALEKLKRNGFGGPPPTFPFGNLDEMKREKKIISTSFGTSANINHDIHAIVTPYYARWQKFHGKLFIYWLGTEPFLYISDPEFLRKMSSDVMGKSWGKPNVFKRDSESMFGSGLNMVEGEEWVQHRRIITPAFSPTSLKAMTGLMVESTKKMLDQWRTLIDSGKQEIDVETEIVRTAGVIIGKAIFGLNYENGRIVFEKLRALQVTLYSSHSVGVPYGKFLNPERTLKAKRLGKEIDSLLLQIILDRKNSLSTGDCSQDDFLGLLLKENHGEKMLTTRELIDECKTFLFGGHETTALAISWTLLLLAVHPEWQYQLREEIREVVGDREVESTAITGLKKMEWVMKETLRLYSPAPNVQRQVREDIQVDDKIISGGTNVWIDVVSMHHDSDLWGDDVNEFKPQRFTNDRIYGGCKHKMGYMPFGFGGRMCIGRNLTMTEYKIVLTLILSKFSFSLSPSYRHCPTTLLSLRPAYGLPLIVHSV